MTFTHRINPETVIVNQIRSALWTAGIPTFKHWGGPMGEPGIPDIIGTLPGGRALFIEVKTPKTIKSFPSNSVTQQAQDRFLKLHSKSGAACAVVATVNDALIVVGVIGQGFRFLAGGIRYEEGERLS